MFHHVNGTGAPGARTVLTLALAAGLLAGTLPSTSRVEASNNSLTCWIDVTERSGSTMLEGVVVAKSAIDGSYDLVVTKSGNGGSSDINQSGSFSAAPGRETPLGAVTLSDTAGSYKARLVVSIDGSSKECRKTAGGAL